MNIEKIDRAALRCEAPEGLFLGFPTGMNPKRFNSADTVALKKSSGLIVGTKGEVDFWPINRFIEFEGSIVALGPWIEGSTAFEADSAGAEDFLFLISLIESLADSSYPISGLYIPALRRLAKGGILAFPPALASWARESSPESSLIDDWETWNHPDLSGAEAWTFSLASLTWHILGGGDPYKGEKGDERRERIRKETVPSICVAVPNITPVAASTIDRSLAPRESRRPDLAEWSALATRWTESGILEKESNEASLERSAAARRRAESMEKRLVSSRWFRKSGWKFLAVATSVILLAFILSAPIRKALEMPVTAGMNPMEVARTYYDAIDSLDSVLMDDCLSRNTGKGDTRLVETVYVSHKVRQGYEGLGDLPRAETWRDEGRPELPEGVWPWGISDLELRERPDGRIEAEYLFWTPGERGDSSSAEGRRQRDTLSFSETRRSWEISGIERTISD